MWYKSIEKICFGLASFGSKCSGVLNLKLSSSPPLKFVTMDFFLKTPLWEARGSCHHLAITFTKCYKPQQCIVHQQSDVWFALQVKFQVIEFQTSEAAPCAIFLSYCKASLNDSTH